MPSASSAGYSLVNSVGSTASSLYTGMTTLSLGVSCMPYTLTVRRHGALRLEQGQQFAGFRSQEIGRAARLDIEPDQGLGVGAAQIEAPLRKLERYAVGAVDGLCQRRVAGL